MKDSPLLLHLSDLHLGSNDPDYSDSKSEIIPRKDRESRLSVLRRTIKQLGQHLTGKAEKLDGVLITGDISYADDEDGFEELHDLLELLGRQLPKPDQIVIIPGNHDVKRGALPGSKMRYEHFQRHICKRGYITPLLDGIDFGAVVRKTKSFRGHYALDLEGGWFVLPVNTSNYCQLIEPIAPIKESDWKQLSATVKAKDVKAAEKVLSELRLNDAARISIQQFEAMEEIISEVEGRIRASGRDAKPFLRIAMLHHHLLPVSTVEEIKKFETFTNLGLLLFPHSPLLRICGANAEETYGRILTLLNTDTESACNVVCQVDDPSTAGMIPAQYPPVPGIDLRKRQDWFQQLVNWWQLSSPTLSKSLHFTHGERITRAGQLDRVARLLAKRALSSRAVVTLCNPEVDDIADHRKKFPSFCLVQFAIREIPPEKPRLDCVAFFRKQEMKYWWPVNIAELAKLQKDVFERIPKKDKYETLVLGSITTFASITRIGKRPPQVSVPAIDRYLDQDRQLLWSMAYSLFWKNMPRRKGYLAEWGKILDELVPDPSFDPDGGPVPLNGLTFLSSEIKRFADHHADINCTNLVTALDELLEQNIDYIEALYEDEDKARKKHPEWCKKAKQVTDNIRREIDRMLG